MVHDIVTHDYFLLLTGGVSIISFCMAFFAVKKVRVMDKSIHQKQSGSNNQQAGGKIQNG